MTPGSQAKFRRWLDEQIKIAGDAAKLQIHQKFPDTYRHGYRDGELHALLDVRAYFTGEEY